MRREWNNGVHNSMTYMTGDIPVGAYNSARLSNSASAMARSTPAAPIPIKSGDRARILGVLA